MIICYYINFFVIFFIDYSGAGASVLIYSVKEVGLLSRYWDIYHRIACVFDNINNLIIIAYWHLFRFWNIMKLKLRITAVFNRHIFWSFWADHSSEAYRTSENSYCGAGYGCTSNELMIFLFLIYRNKSNWGLIVIHIVILGLRLIVNGWYVLSLWCFVIVNRYWVIRRTVILSINVIYAA